MLPLIECINQLTYYQTPGIIYLFKLIIIIRKVRVKIRKGSS